MRKPAYKVVEVSGTHICYPGGTALNGRLVAGWLEEQSKGGWRLVCMINKDKNAIFIRDDWGKKEG